MVQHEVGQIANVNVGKRCMRIENTVLSSWLWESKRELLLSIALVCLPALGDGLRPSAEAESGSGVREGTKTQHWQVLVVHGI